MASEPLKPIRILLVAPLPPPAGGVATWTAHLLSHAASCPDVEITHLDSAQRLRTVTRLGTGERIWSGLALAIPLSFRLWKCLLRTRQDLIHCATSAGLGLFRDLAIALIARFFHVPAVFHLHFGRVPELAVRQNWEWRLLCRLARTAAAVVVLDRPSLDALRKAGFADIHLIPNPLSPALEKELGWGLSAGSLRKRGCVLFVGHIVSTKGIRELVGACAALPEVEELRLVGPVEKNFQDEITGLARGKDQGRWLAVVGLKDHAGVMEEMRSATVLALPSYSEGFPLVILEAMAAGCPVVAAGVGAVPDMLGAETATPAGVCIAPRDENALRDALRNLLQHPETAEALAHASLKKVVADYSMQKVFGSIVTHWRQVAGRS